MHSIQHLKNMFIFNADKILLHARSEKKEAKNENRYEFNPG